MLPRNIRLFTWFNFFTDFRLYAPVAILYYQQVTGSFAAGMSIFSITMLAAALFEVPTGILSDRMGRHRTVITGAVFSTVAVIFYAFASGDSLTSHVAYILLAGGAITEGISRAFYSGNNQAMLHDTLSAAGLANNFDHYLGKTQSMFQIALAISAILGSLIATFSFPLVLWLSVVPQIICIILAWRMVEPGIHSHEETNVFEHLKKAVSAFRHSRKLRWLSLASIWGESFGEAAYQFQAAFYATLWPVWAIGIAKILGNMGAAAGMHWGSTVIKRLGLERTMIGSVIVQRSLVLGAAAFPTLASPLIISASSLPMGVGWIAEGTLFQREFQPKQRATMSSLVSFAGSILFAIVSFLVGLVGDTFSPYIGYLLLQLVQIVGVWWRWQIVRKV